MILSCCSTSQLDRQVRKVLRKTTGGERAGQRSSIHQLLDATNFLKEVVGQRQADERRSGLEFSMRVIRYVAKPNHLRHGHSLIRMWLTCQRHGGVKNVAETLAGSVRQSSLGDGLVYVIGRHLVDVAIEDRESGHSLDQLWPILRHSRSQARPNRHQE